MRIANADTESNINVYTVSNNYNVCYLTLENSHFTQKRRDWRGGQKEFIVISVI